MIVVGVDPGLAYCGWARLDTHGARLLGTGLVTTHKGDQVGDTQRRLLELVDGLRAPIGSADLVVVEWSSVSGAGFQRSGDGAAHGNARAALLNAAAAAAAVALAAARRVQVLTPAPVTWRSRLGYRVEAELHGRLEALYPRTAARYSAGRRRHVFDALGLALFGRDHAVNQLRTTEGS